MIRHAFTATCIGTACMLAAFGLFTAPAPLSAVDAIDTGRFVWHDLMTKDVAAAKRFYGGLFGWQFENTKRGDRPYVIARLGAAVDKFHGGAGRRQDRLTREIWWRQSAR